MPRSLRVLTYQFRLRILTYQFRLGIGILSLCFPSEKGAGASFGKKGQILSQEAPDIGEPAISLTVLIVE
jgi:hypothetical protein